MRLVGKTWRLGTLVTLEDFIERLQRAKALKDLQSATEELCEHYSIAHIVYHWVNSVGERFGCGTYSSEWVDLHPATLPPFNLAN